jgi:hypothetical protein
MDRQTRNFNPHKAAWAAMYLFGERYSRQNGGSMDFWDTLSESEKRLCRYLVKVIEESPAEPNPHT